MIDNKFIERLADLKHLSVLKNHNINIMSKPNKFQDAVKFFAQIDDKNFIHKITFKATGCTMFMVMCSYFCELVESKSIEDALEINVDYLQSKYILNDNSVHVLTIIVDTFALLIKKYKKWLSTGKTQPYIHVESKNVENLKSRKVKQKESIEFAINDSKFEKILENKIEVQPITKKKIKKDIIETKTTETKTEENIITNKNKKSVKNSKDINLFEEKSIEKNIVQVKQDVKDIVDVPIVEEKSIENNVEIAISKIEETPAQIIDEKENIVQVKSQKELKKELKKEKKLAKKQEKQNDKNKDLVIVEPEIVESNNLVIENSNTQTPKKNILVSKKASKSVFVNNEKTEETVVEEHYVVAHNNDNKQKFADLSKQIEKIALESHKKEVKVHDTKEFNNLLNRLNATNSKQNSLNNIKDRLNKISKK